MGSSPEAADPIRAIVEAGRRDRAWLGAALSLAALLHLVVAFGIERLPERKPGGANPPSQVVFIDSPPPPPARAGAPERPPASRPPAATKPRSGLARAGEVLTVKPGPDEPVDLTGQGFVTGSSSAYAGGFTSSKGTSRRAVPSQPSSGPASPEPEAAGPDRSRRATLEGGAQWHCPFPPEADGEEINSAVVPIRVDLDATGLVREVAVLSDPGHGFGREAERCARGKRFTPALDRDGNPIETRVTIRVHFER